MGYKENACLCPDSRIPMSEESRNTNEIQETGLRVHYRNVNVNNRFVGRGCTRPSKGASVYKGLDIRALSIDLRGESLGRQTGDPFDRPDAEISRPCDRKAAGAREQQE